MPIDIVYNGHDVSVAVAYDYWPYVPGRLCGPFEDRYPPEPEQVEVGDIVIVETTERKLLGTTLDYDDLPRETQDRIRQAIADYEQDRAAARHESAEERGRED